MGTFSRLRGQNQAARLTSDHAGGQVSRAVFLHLWDMFKGEAGPESISRDVACRSCGATMPGRDNEFVLKYFHLRNAGRSRWEKGKRR
jgi:hypothetical protein